MADDPSTKPLGFNIDIGDILRDVVTPKKPARRRTPRATTSRTTRSSGSGDMDAAVRRAVRAELVDVERALRDLAEEVVRLRKANQSLTEKVAKLLRG